jgi:hypothetical protein
MLIRLLLSCLALPALAGTLDSVSRLRAATEVENKGTAIAQQLQCYDYSGCSGDSVIANDYMPYISYHNMDNRIESCYFQGIWILYGEEVYNRDNLGAHNTWGFSTNGQVKCMDMPANFKNDASSLRYSGHPADMYQNSINMYFSEYFMGDEEFAYSDSPVLNYDNSAQSIIVTGYEPWTIYQHANYQGYKACLYPGQAGSPAFYWTRDTLQSLANDISSVAKGCFAKERFYPNDHGNSTAAGFSYFH